MIDTNIVECSECKAVYYVTKLTRTTKPFKINMSILKNKCCRKNLNFIENDSTNIFSRQGTTETK